MAAAHEILKRQNACRDAFRFSVSVSTTQSTLSTVLIPFFGSGSTSGSRALAVLRVTSALSVVLCFITFDILSLILILYSFDFNRRWLQRVSASHLGIPYSARLWYTQPEIRRARAGHSSPASSRDNCRLSSRLERSIHVKGQAAVGITIVQQDRANRRTKTANATRAGRPETPNSGPCSS